MYTVTRLNVPAATAGDETVPTEYTNFYNDVTARFVKISQYSNAAANLYNALKTSADTLARAADEDVAAAMNFKPDGTLPANITLTTPTFEVPTSSMTPVPAGQPALPPDPSTLTALTSAEFTTRLALSGAPTPVSIRPPTRPTLDSTTQPNILSTVTPQINPLSAPIAPTKPNIQITPPQTPEAPAAPAAPVIPSTPLLLSENIEGFSTDALPEPLEIDDVISAIDAIAQQLSLSGEFDYPRIESVAQLSSSVDFATSRDERVSGFEDQSQALYIDRISAITGEFSKRGFTPPSAMSQYAEALLERDEMLTKTYVAAALERLSDDDYQTNLQICASAHSMLMDIVQRLFELNVDRVLVSAQVELQRVKAVVALYNASVVQLESDRAVYEAQLEQHAAAARQFKIAMSEQDTVADTNEVVAQGAAADMRVAALVRDTYAGKVEVERAKVKAFSSEVAGRAATVASAELSVAKYKSELLKWAAEVTALRSAYAQESAKLDLNVAKNRTAAALARASAADVEAFVSDVEQKLAQTSAQLAKLRAETTQSAALQATAQLQNVVEAAKLSIASDKYVAETERAAATNGRLAAINSASASQSSAAVRYAASAVQAATQSTISAQSVNNTLASTYASLYEAAGRAQAAVQSGKLSGFRASQGVSANFNLNGRRSWSVSNDQSQEKSVSQTDAYSPESSV